MDDSSGLYHTCKPIVQKEFDPASGPQLPEIIVKALAEATDVHPMDLPPLHHTVDLDALSVLFSADRADTRGVYVFTYESWDVIITHGQVCVCDQSIRTEPKSVFQDSNN